MIKRRGIEGKEGMKRKMNIEHLVKDERPTSNVQLRMMNEKDKKDEHRTLNIEHRMMNEKNVAEHIFF